MRSFDVLLASHGGLAAAFVGAAELICGRSGGLTAVDLRTDETPESYSERLRAAIHQARRTLILTDLFGGTPHNVACALARRDLVWCISGINLGLLIETLTTGDELDDGLVERLVGLGREGVVDVGVRLANTRV